MPFFIRSQIKCSRLFTGAILLALLLAPPHSAKSAPEAMPVANSHLNLVRVIDTSKWDPSSPDPVGITYLQDSQRLLVSDSEVEETVHYEDANVYEATTDGGLIAAGDVTCFSNEPTGLGVNPDNGHIFISDDSMDMVFEVDRGADGQFCTPDDVLAGIDTRTFGSLDPEGVAFGLGKLFIADGNGKLVYIILPGANGVFDGPPPGGDDVLSQFATEDLGLRNPKGIGYHLERGTLFIISRSDEALVETTPQGVLIKQYDFSFAGVVDPSGLAIGPNSQDSDETSIYITDRGVDNDHDPNENDGKLFEFTLPVNIYLPVVSK